MEQLKRGQIAVDKKRIVSFCDIVADVEKKIDVIMKEKESEERGRKIAEQMNRLTFARHTVQHFDLNVPLKKLK